VSKALSYGVEALLTQRTEIDAELRKHKSPVTVMFTDLAGSTSYFDRYGDTAGVKWIEEHNRIVIPQVQQYQGTVVKTIGDSVMAYFTDPLGAVRSARAIQQTLQAANQDKDKKDWMFIRIALHQGLGYLRGGDVFGDVVNVTARMAKACLPAQVLVSEAVCLAVHGAEGVDLRPVGEALFHGKSEKETLYEMLWTSEEAYAELRALFPAPKTSAPVEELTEGRYRIMGELGRGAMGVVYKAYDRIIGRVVALKTIPVEVQEAEKAQLVERLKVEARAAGMLDHPNIVTVYDVGEEAGLFYFTMQFLEGKTLAQAHADRELLPLGRVQELMQQLCAAVGFAHKSGVIHRDLKPSNLMVNKQGTLKILDFGIAKLADVGLTKAGMIMGTPSYLAPEQAGGRRIDSRADIFSIGAILYELLSGERAFPGDTTTTVIYKILNDDPIPLRAIEPSLPPALDVVVRKALAKDPLQRFQTCEEMAEALRQVAQGGTLNLEVPAPRTAGAAETVATPMTPALAAKRSRRPLAVAAVLVLALAAGVGAWLLWRRPPPAESFPSSQESKPAEPAPIAAPKAPLGETKAAIAGKEAPSNGAAAPEVSARVKPAGAGGGSEAPLETSGQGGRSLFSQADIPALLARADGYAGKGQYDRAISLYQVVLKIDPRNQSAREGLQRAREARSLRP
jgi:class 3 adenylate cyclase/predicted Ser/Thr protein kinase